MSDSVSVVTPLYNKVEFVERALKSVFDQTLQPTEIVVVDDGSSDGGAELVERVDDARIRLIRQANAGVSAARNRGIEAAQGALIAFLDADDEWMPEFLETVVRLHSNYPTAGAYATAYTIIEGDGSEIVPPLINIPTAPWEGLLDNYFSSSLPIENRLIFKIKTCFKFHFGEPVWSSAVAVKKSVFEEIGGFPLGEPQGEDLEMWGRIAIKYPIAYSTKLCSVYHNEVSPYRKIVKELPFVRYYREAEAKGLIDESILQDVRDYVNMTQINCAIQCIAGFQDTKMGRNLLKDCPPSSLYKLPWLWWYFWSLMPAGLIKGARAAKQAIFR
ncbi:MAG: glycosyltransferase family 2 protein [Syntrophomonas sp.]